MNTSSVCPWWAGYPLNNRARRLLHRPEKILKNFVHPGTTAMDVGCGMGFFTLPLAHLVGERGRVIAVDLQEKMLEGMMKGAEKAGISHRIIAHRCKPETLDVGAYAGGVDFAILFMMLHEVPDQRRLIRELRQCLRPGGAVLFAEPIVHVPKRQYRQSLDLFREEGFPITAQPSIDICRAAVLRLS